MADRRRGSGDDLGFYSPGRYDRLGGVLCLGELRPEHKTPPDKGDRTMRSKQYLISTEHGMRDFVTSYWQDFAPFAYAAYLVEGRGAVLITTGKTAYLKRDDVAYLVDNGRMDPALLPKVEAYNPDTDVVIVVDTEDEVFTLLHHNCDESPKDLWLAQTKGDKPL